MTARTDYHYDTARESLARARAHLAGGDLAQASAKGWEAAARLVESVAEARGWPHDDPGKLCAAINRLAKETGDKELHRHFACAIVLHTDSYEGWMERQNVADGLDQVAELVEKLEALVA